MQSEKLCVSFELFPRSGQDPEDLAQRICIEQTVELPTDLISDDWIRRRVVGDIAQVAAGAQGAFRADIEFETDTTGGQVPQLLNVLFGNISLMPGVRIVDVSGLSHLLPGPKFGVAGLRGLCREPRGPLVCTALKPMGKSASELASMAFDLALGGIHIIKDDHGLCNQPYAPFRERVERVAQAVRQANRQTGWHSLYFPHLAPPVEYIHDAVAFCRHLEIKGVLVSPFLTGLDFLRFLAQNAPFALMAHPALSGALISQPRHGMRPGFVLGKLFRFLGADASVYPNVGGRFLFDAKTCSDINRELRRTHHRIKPAFPVPAGGMSMTQLPQVRRDYGDNVIFLIGGHLLRTDRNLTRAARMFMNLARDQDPSFE